MSIYSKILNQNVPQTEPVYGKNQVQNNAGGYVFAVDEWTRLERFLVLGSEGGTYYVGERKLTLENVANIEKCLKIDGAKTINTIVNISKAGRAPKNEPALFALAVALKKGDLATRQKAAEVLPQVARIGTHLFHFAEYVKLLGGWGRNTKNAFANWYTSMPSDKLAMQLIKYQQRDGWSHRDILRKSHPNAINNKVKNSLYSYATKGVTDEAAFGENVYNDLDGVSVNEHDAIELILAFEKAKGLTNHSDLKVLVKLIETYKLPHECVPNEMKGHKEVWEAMLPHMGITAIVRNLGKMTNIGLISTFSESERFITKQLRDPEVIKKGRVHPLASLVALNTYKKGHGDKGSLTWNPEQRIVNALEAAFYNGFQAVEPTNKRTLLALDVSGSMSWNDIAGMSGVTPAIGSAAMAMVTARTEVDHHFVAFSDQMVKIGINPTQNLDQVQNAIKAIPMGGTDCALPMLWALKNKVPVDTFQIYTDNETWFGKIHPFQALKEYRQKMGINAKLAVIGMTATEFTIADPSDSGTIDVCGFDTAVPSVIANFAR